MIIIITARFSSKPALPAPLHCICAAWFATEQKVVISTVDCVIIIKICEAHALTPWLDRAVLVLNLLSCPSSKLGRHEPRITRLICHGLVIDHNRVGETELTDSLEDKLVTCTKHIFSLCQIVVVQIAGIPALFGRASTSHLLNRMRLVHHRASFQLTTLS